VMVLEGIAEVYAFVGREVLRKPLIGFSGASQLPAAGRHDEPIVGREAGREPDATPLAV